VFLRNGWAYVPSREQSSIVFQEFQTRLERALEVMHLSVALAMVKWDAEPNRQ
jgi:DNA primase large subunit